MDPDGESRIQRREVHAPFWAATKEAQPGIESLVDASIVVRSLKEQGGLLCPSQVWRAKVDTIAGKKDVRPQHQVASIPNGLDIETEAFVYPILTTSFARPKNLPVGRVLRSRLIHPHEQLPLHLPEVRKAGESAGQYLH